MMAGAGNAGRRVKPLKPAENRHETAWQAWETGETGRIVKKSRVIFFKSSGFTGFPRLPGGFISVSYRFHRFHTPASISSAFCVPELHFGQTGVREPKNPMPNMMSITRAMRTKQDLRTLRNGPQRRTLGNSRGSATWSVGRWSPRPAHTWAEPP